MRQRVETDRANSVCCRGGTGSSDEGTGVSSPERRYASYDPDPGKESRIEIVFLDRKQGQRLGGTELGLSIEQSSEG